MDTAVQVVYLGSSVGVYGEQVERDSGMPVVVAYWGAAAAREATEGRPEGLL
jgi:hypothetical protein